MKKIVSSLFALLLLTNCSKTSVDSKDECKFPFTVLEAELQDKAKPVEQDYDLKKVNCVTTYAQSLTDFPDIEFKGEEYEILSSDEVAKMGLKKVEDLFYETQAYFFKPGLCNRIRSEASNYKKISHFGD